MDAVDHNWKAYLKIVFIIYMSGTILTQTYQATLDWYKIKTNMGRFASILLLFNAFFVILVTIYKFTDKHIAPLFFLQTISHYSFYLTFCVLVKCSENTKV
jgi:hypothetical protein